MQVTRIVRSKTTRPTRIASGLMSGRLAARTAARADRLVTNHAGGHLNHHRDSLARAGVRNSQSLVKGQGVKGRQLHWLHWLARSSGSGSISGKRRFEQRLQPLADLRPCRHSLASGGPGQLRLVVRRASSDRRASGGRQH